jgi:hypothetical protein
LIWPDANAQETLYSALIKYGYRNKTHGSLTMLPPRASGVNTVLFLGLLRMYSGIKNLKTAPADEMIAISQEELLDRVCTPESVFNFTGVTIRAVYRLKRSGLLKP